MVQDNTYISPVRHYYRQRQGQLHFEFAKDGERIKNAYKNNGKTADSACFRLSCMDEPLFTGGAYIKLGQNFQYCFSDLEEKLNTYTGELGVVKCNPYAKPKVEADGKCICTYPYTGTDCESCVAGFHGTKASTRIGDVNQKHTVCIADEETDEGECNGFGTWNRNKKLCVCNKGYSGVFCETCTDSRLKYPECVVDESDLDEEDKIPADSTSKELREFVKQRKQQVYENDYLKQDRGSVFQQ